MNSYLPLKLRSSLLILWALGVVFYLYATDPAQSGHARQQLAAISVPVSASDRVLQNNGCPYPPDQPAVEGGAEVLPDFFQMLPVTDGPVMPAVYYEVGVPVEGAAESALVRI